MEILLKDIWALLILPVVLAILIKLVIIPTGKGLYIRISVFIISRLLVHTLKKLSHEDNNTTKYFNKLNNLAERLENLNKNGRKRN